MNGQKFHSLDMQSWQLHTPTNLLLLSLAVSDFLVGFDMLFQIMLIDGCWFLAHINLLFSFSRQLHTPTNLLLLSLAVSDFLVGFDMLFQIMLIDGCWFLGDLMCTLACVFDYLATCSSIAIMVLISVDRYIAICDPLHYLIKVTPRRVQVCVVMCWIFSFFFMSVLMKDNLEQPGKYNTCVGECVINITYIDQVAHLLLLFIVPISVIIVLYTGVFVVAVAQARAMRSHIAAVSLQRSMKVSAKKSELKAARTLGVVIVVFLICICPYFCATFKGQDSLISVSAAVFLIFLFYFNSCLNPVIYVLFYPWFRKSIRLVVTLQILRPCSRDTKIL
ncbi:trace amine-associated receptor 13c-like [Channa argus]|uniref:trace amine-associated receptor 13c-like n=1 Tax=Channa argus TaxID=215402 RepID=UPI0035225223